MENTRNGFSPRSLVQNPSLRNCLCSSAAMKFCWARKSSRWQFERVVLTQSLSNAARRAAPQFRVGDRVRLSELGKSGAPRTKVQTGVVFSVPVGGRSVQVIFDGNRQPTRIHRSYIELDSDYPDQNLKVRQGRDRSHSHDPTCAPEHSRLRQL
jgi:hypothetical protein